MLPIQKSEMVKTTPANMGLTESDLGQNINKYYILYWRNPTQLVYCQLVYTHLPTTHLVYHSMPKTTISPTLNQA